MGSSLVNRVLDVFGFLDYEEDSEGMPDNTGEGKIEALPGIKYRKDKVVNIQSNQSARVMVCNLARYEDVTTICDRLKENSITIADLRDLEAELKQRCVDFLSGAIYTLDGDIREIAPYMLLLAPRSVNVSSEMKEQLSNCNMLSCMNKNN